MRSPRDNGYWKISSDILILAMKMKMKMKDRRLIPRRLQMMAELNNSSWTAARKLLHSKGGTKGHVVLNWMNVRFPQIMRTVQSEIRNQVCREPNYDATVQHPQFNIDSCFQNLYWELSPGARELHCLHQQWRVICKIRIPFWRRKLVGSAPGGFGPLGRLPFLCQPISFQHSNHFGHLRSVGG